MQDKIAEMLGLVRGVLFDGVVTPDEAEGLRDWLDAHPDVVEQWPGSTLARRLEAIFEDGEASEQECEELREVLELLRDGRALLLQGPREPVGIFDDPLPDLECEGRTFSFAGGCAYGSADTCRKAVEARGGVVARSVSDDVDYLVVGAFATRDWFETTFGISIVRAVDRLREKHPGVAVVPEQHWYECL